MKQFFNSVKLKIILNSFKNSSKKILNNYMKYISYISYTSYVSYVSYNSYNTDSNIYNPLI